MKVVVRSIEGVTPADADRARRRLTFALGRFARHVRHVHVRLADINGLRGGVDKQCIVAVRLTHPGRLVVIEDIDSDFRVAIDRAAERAGRSVSRLVHAFAQWTPGVPRSA